MNSKRRPIVLIHGLWNSADVFKAIIKRLDEYDIEYYAPTLIHNFGMISIIELARSLNSMILMKFGSEREIDILGFSMGGIIARYWIKNFLGYKRTKKFISIGSPHFGTLTAQMIPSYPLKGISEMKVNSNLLIELLKDNSLLNDIDCVSFFTIWDLMVFPGWKACLPVGKKISLNIYKHKNLVRETKALDKIIQEIIN